MPLDQIEQVHCAKLLGIYLSDTLQFETHLVNLLKICSQRTYLLKLLRDQGMPRTHLNTIFRAIILANITYALPAWRGFLTVEQIGRTNSFLKRAFKYGLCSQLVSFLDLADDADQTLLNSMLKKQHCLQVILPKVKTSSLHLRQKGHMFDLPSCTLEMHYRSFLPRCFFKFI